MQEDAARSIITQSYPDLDVEEIKEIGEGVANIAFEVNQNLIFRFPKKADNQKQLEQEIALQPLLQKYSSLPVPNFTYIPLDHSFVGYAKLPGTALLYQQAEFTDWAKLCKQLGEFLTQLHTIPEEEVTVLNIQTEKKIYQEWLRDNKIFYEKTKHVIPEQYYAQIESFFHTLPRIDVAIPVLCHNNLGIKHILVNENEITGIIDWGGAALTDPACDFARLYRDLGEEILDETLNMYTAITDGKETLRARAIFYGKCLVFEDLFYGLERSEYREKCLTALNWMF